MRYFKLTLFFVAAVVLLLFDGRAQAPYKFSYQAVVRNSTNQLIRNKTIGLRLTIREGSASGTILFQERHTPVTNDNGLFSVAIADGTLLQGDFLSIDWGSNIFFLQSDIDVTGGTSYTITSVQQLISVPYALHCNEYQTLEDVVNRDNHAGMVQLKDVQDPTDPQDAVTKIYLDSVMNLMMGLLDNHRYDSVKTACGSFVFNGQTITQSGVYLQRLSKAASDGTDSVICLRLTINNGTHNVYYDTACTGSYTWLASGTKGHGTGSVYAAAGVYEGVDYLDAESCPSKDTLYLAYGTSNSGTDTRVVCDSLVWIDGNKYKSDNTTATHVLTGANQQGCDSTVTLHLTVNHASESTYVASGCGSYTWGLTGDTYTTVPAEAPKATLTGQDVNGCDSIVTLSLTLHDMSDVVDSQQIASGGSLDWYGKSYTTEVTDGSVTHQFTDANGCVRDSVLYLTISDPCESVVTPTISGTTTICSGSSTTLSVSNTQSGYTYHWSNGSTGTSISTSTAGTYYCYATTTSPACTTANSNSLTTSVITISASLAISPTSATVDVGEAVVLALSYTKGNASSNSGYTFTRNTTSNNTLTQASGQLSYQRTFTATATGTYTVTGSTTVSRSGCTADLDATCTITVEEAAVSAPTGCLPGVFTVSSTKKVYISVGNLNWQGSTSKYMFASKQYISVGNASGNSTLTVSTRKSQSGLIDLFPSGTGSNASYYWPYGLPTTTSGSTTAGKCKVFSQNASGDWGYGNTIYLSDGSTSAGTGWYTLTMNEMYTLLYKGGYQIAARQNKTGTGSIKVGSTTYYGLIILPDEFTDPECAGSSGNTAFSPNNSSAPTSTSVNYYTEANWNKMEALGACFLPAAGYGSGNTSSSIVNDQYNATGPCGWYWLCGGYRLNWTGKNKCVVGSSPVVDNSKASYTYYRMAVRLVKTVE